MVFQTTMPSAHYAPATCQVHHSLHADTTLHITGNLRIRRTDSMAACMGLAPATHTPTFPRSTARRVVLRTKPRPTAAPPPVFDPVLCAPLVLRRMLGHLSSCATAAFCFEVRYVYLEHGNTSFRRPPFSSLGNCDVSRDCSGRILSTWRQIACGVGSTTEPQAYLRSERTMFAPKTLVWSPVCKRCPRNKVQELLNRLRAIYERRETTVRTSISISVFLIGLRNAMRSLGTRDDFPLWT